MEEARQDWIRKNKERRNEVRVWWACGGHMHLRGGGGSGAGRQWSSEELGWGLLATQTHTHTHTLTHIHIHIHTHPTATQVRELKKRQARDREEEVRKRERRQEKERQERESSAKIRMEQDAYELQVRGGCVLGGWRGTGSWVRHVYRAGRCKLGEACGCTHVSVHVWVCACVVCYRYATGASVDGWVPKVLAMVSGLSAWCMDVL